ncbi:hypothetical protein [Kitasatospora sp. NPDC086791]|uniref:hypothetical protein n=1 Tax=Kitasatospora sp. NPDC086791 TaxID=3155178 RepID=UPI00342D37EB
MLRTDLTVSVDGYLEPVTQTPRTALDTLWQTVRALPMDDCQRRGMALMLGSGSTADLERWMGDDSATTITVGLADGSRAIVRVSYADGLTAAQRVASRYSVEELPADDRGRRPWVIRDAETGGLVSAGTSGVRPLEFAIRESADAWIRGRVNLAGYRVMPYVPATR